LTDAAIGPRKGRRRDGSMENQTDGVEWVLATMFVLGFVAVLVAAVLEIRRFRRGDPGGEARDDGTNHPE
jgi:hypothetical protein